jgi:hypothetical protein
MLLIKPRISIIHNGILFLSIYGLYGIVDWEEIVLLLYKCAHKILKEVLKIVDFKCILLLNKMYINIWVIKHTKE